MMAEAGAAINRRPTGSGKTESAC